MDVGGLFHASYIMICSKEIGVDYVTKESQNG